MADAGGDNEEKRCAQFAPEHRKRDAIPCDRIDPDCEIRGGGDDNMNAPMRKNGGGKLTISFFNFLPRFNGWWHKRTDIIIS